MVKPSLCFDILLIESIDKQTLLAMELSMTTFRQENLKKNHLLCFIFWNCLNIFIYVYTIYNNLLKLINKFSDMILLLNRKADDVEY